MSSIVPGLTTDAVGKGRTTSWREDYMTPPRSDDKEREAKRQRSFHSAKDFETSSSQIGDIGPIGDDIKERARLVVAANSADAAECVEFLKALGIHSSQPDWEDGPVTAPSRQFNAMIAPKGA